MIKLNMFGGFYTSIWLAMASLNVSTSTLLPRQKEPESWGGEKAGAGPGQLAYLRRSSANDQGRCISAQTLHKYELCSRPSAV